MPDLSHARSGNPWFKRPRGALAGPLAVLIFAVDTFTDIESAIAVLYVLVLLLAANGLPRAGIVRFGGACAGLALLSFLLSHAGDVSLAAVLRCVVSLSAILITTILLARDHASRQLLVQANAALGRSEKRYRSIFEQARFSLWEQDFSGVKTALAGLRAQGVDDLAEHARANPGFARDLIGRIVTTDVNDATLELLGATSRAQILGPIERFLPPSDPSMLRIMQVLFDGGNRFEGRARLIAADGRSLTVLLGITFPDDALPEEGLGFDRVVSGVVDITERERTQEALIAAQAELARASRAATMGAFSASIAHELNQPLGALVMNAQTCLRWLRRDAPDLEAAAKAAERTVRDGKRASEIVQRTRERLVRGVNRDEAFDMTRLVEETIPLLDRELAGQAAVCRTAFAADLPPVRASRVEMQQVLVNLLTNGLQAMEEARSAVRELAVAVDRPAAGWLRVAVRDRGPGIGGEDHAKLFDPFFTTKAGGMGMGLAICRATVEAQGGRLTARNHEEGGAVFEFTLPLGEPAPARPSSAEPLMDGEAR